MEEFFREVNFSGKNWSNSDEEDCTENSSHSNHTEESVNQESEKLKWGK